MFSRLLSLLRPTRLIFALTVACALAGGLLAVGQAAALSQLVARVFLGGEGMVAVTALFRLLLLLVSLRAGLAWANEALAGRVSVRLKTWLRGELFSALLRLGPAYTRGQKTGELSAILFDGVEALGTYFSQYLPQAALAALLPLAILTLVFPRDWPSGLILLLTAPLIPVFMYLIGKGAEALTRRQWDVLRWLEAHFLDSLQGLVTLKLFGRSRQQADAIASTTDRFRRVTLKVLQVTFLSAFVLELISTISTAMVAVELSLRLLYGRMPFETAFFLLLLAPEFYLPLRVLGLRFHAGMAGTTAARRIFEVLDKAEKMPQQPVADDQNKNFSALRVANITYAYPGETQPALQDLDMEIKRGEHVAVVGLTGAGKTTLAGLLLGFMPPDRGQICLDGQPLESWREQIAWVPQTPHLFHDTLSANLRLAQPDATMAQMEAALRNAALEDFVHSLPAGLETVIGESGARLSGGEAQRLALARAFLKDVPILLLDEPASHLDPLNETALVESIRRLGRGRTVITIAHRMKTILEADRIFVLDEGKLAASGTHAALLAENGVYARLVRGQELVQEDFLSPESVEAPLSSGLISLTPAIPGLPQPFASAGAPSARSLARLLTFLRGSWGWVVLSVLLGVLTIGSSVGLMGTAAYLISTAALAPAFGALQIAIVGVRFFGITRGAFRYAERLASHEVTFRLLGRLRSWFYRALEPLAPARLMQFRSGDLLARIVADVDTLESFYARALVPPLVALLVAVGLSLFLGRYAAGLASTYAGFMVLLGLVLPGIAWAFSRRIGEQLILRRATLQALLVDGLRGLADLLAFGRGRNYSARLLITERDFGSQQERLASVSGLFNGLVLFGMNSGVLAVLALSIPLVESGRVPGPMLAALALAVQASFEAILPLSSTAQALASCSQAARRLFEVVDIMPEVNDPPIPGRLTPAAPSLDVFGLDFTYPGSPQPALQGIDLSLPSGKRIAIVGPSGSGKSTLASLLLRFWDYSMGRIQINGLDLHALAQEEVRSLFSVLPQSPAFLDGTIRQNLLLARADANDSQLQVALRRACLEEFVNNLSGGLDTPLGEAGLRLSGGERQRLALARVYLKDAPILLLDEPFVHLDRSTEAALQQRLHASLGERSLLLITHHLTGLEIMDEILVLDSGRVVQRGMHARLVSQDGLYRRMCE
jgi:ATP-binding cassette subfamily C protein CydCD